VPACPHRLPALAPRAAKLGQSRESLALLKGTNMVQALITASVRTHAPRQWLWSLMAAARASLAGLHPHSVCARTRVAERRRQTMCCHVQAVLSTWTYHMGTNTGGIPQYRNAHAMAAYLSIAAPSLPGARVLGGAAAVAAVRAHLLQARAGAHHHI
jgi:hypothetical protein